MQLSIIIPVYNEQDSVGDTVDRVKKAMETTDIKHEIIAVNDDSSDISGEILDKIEGIKVLHHNSNRGYGASLKTGIKNSQYDWIIITDADGTYPVEDIPKLVQQKEDSDLVIGSREKKNAAIPFKRRHAKKFLNKFASYLADKTIPDLNSGLRLFRKDIVYKYWNLFPEKFSFTSTLTMICSTKGYSLKFIPIDYRKRVGKSSIKPTDFFRFLKLIAKLSLFFKPIKVFAPMSLLILLVALTIPIGWLLGYLLEFYDATFIVLCATALQTLFFGLLAEVVINNK